MSQDDPFGNYLDEDKTVLKPSPGRRNQQNQSVAPTPSPVQQQTPIPDQRANDTDSFQGLAVDIDYSNNPLVNNAMSLLSLVTQLRNTSTHSDVQTLRHVVINEIKQFDQQALQAGCMPEQVQTARYALCSLIDEIVLNTPWGGNSIWSTQGMLISFHKEAWGGEKFFQVLDKIIVQPGTYFNLLEFYYYCLSLGFEGKYKIQEQGQNKLFDVRENLYRVLQRHKGDFEQDLSLQWKGITDKRNILSRFIPLWVIALIVAALLVLIYIGFLYAINQDSGVEIGQQYTVRDGLNIKRVVEKRPVIIPSTSPEIPQLTAIEQVQQFLEPEIEQNKVAVLDKNGEGIIRIIAKNFFASGSDIIQTKYMPLMQRISEALEIIEGQITVVGHTDNDPIFTVKYPSNWVLSQARAQRVANILLKNVNHKNKVIAEGRADTQSLVPNDSSANKAINRRVEIIF